MTARTSVTTPPTDAMTVSMFLSDFSAPSRIAVRALEIRTMESATAFAFLSNSPTCFLFSGDSTSLTLSNVALADFTAPATSGSRRRTAARISSTAGFAVRATSWMSRISSFRFTLSGGCAAANAGLSRKFAGTTPLFGAAGASVPSRFWILSIVFFASGTSVRTDLNVSLASSSARSSLGWIVWNFSSRSNARATLSSDCCALARMPDAGVSRLRGVMGGRPGMSDPGGHSSPRATGSPSSASRGTKSIAVSPLSSPLVMMASSDFRGRYLRSMRNATRTWPDSGSRSRPVTSPMRTPDLRIGMPGAMPGASENRTAYLTLVENSSGARPKKTMRPARMASAPATNAPSLSRIPRSAMSAFPIGDSRLAIEAGACRPVPQSSIVNRKSAIPYLQSRMRRRICCSSA